MIHEESLYHGQIQDKPTMHNEPIWMRKRTLLLCTSYFSVLRTNRLFEKPNWPNNLIRHEKLNPSSKNITKMKKQDAGIYKRRLKEKQESSITKKGKKKGANGSLVLGQKPKQRPMN